MCKFCSSFFFYIAQLFFKEFCQELNQHSRVEVVLSYFMTKWKKKNVHKEKGRGGGISIRVEDRLVYIISYKKISFAIRKDSIQISYENAYKDGKI